MGTNGQEQNKVELDTILREEIGQFGWFQLKLLLLIIPVGIFQSWSCGGYLFITARINSRCLIPECDTIGPEFSPWWIDQAVPVSSDGTLDGCQRYGTISNSSGSDTCSADLFNLSVLQPCEDYVYQNTDTIVYDFGLACQEWRRSVVGSIRTLGMMVALVITGYVSDRWGRRITLIINSINAAWLGVLRYWASTYIGFIASEFLEAAFSYGAFGAAYVLLLETMGPKYRVAAGACMNSLYSFGQVLLGLIAWGVPNWRNLILILYIPQFITILYLWYTSESVRWYMSKGRYAESEALLQKIAKTNGKTLSPKSLEALRRTAEEEKKMKLIEEQEKSDWLIMIVFRRKKILLRCLVTPIWWIANTLVYYGMSINSVNILSGNSYINFVAISAVEIPGYWTAFLLLHYLGRKPLLIGAYWVCAACQVTYIFLPNDFYGVSLFVYLIGKYTIAMTTTAVYAYTAELYPTKYRHTLFGFSSTIGRLGSVVAPLTPAIGAATFEKMPFIFFGGFAVLASLLVLTTPETLGTTLPDTMEEAENLSKKRTTT